MSSARPSARSRAAQQRSEWLEREQRRRRLIIGAWAGLAVLFVAMLAYLVWQEAQPEARPGETIPIQSRDHIQPGQPHDPYTTDPPTSGPHYDQPVEAGFYEEAPADEYLVHNMEHGHVIIWYNCTGLSEADCTALKDDLRNTMGRAGVSAVTGTLKLNAVPRPSLDVPIVLTSWGHMQRLDAFDRDAILTFIRAYRDEAPEPGAP
jgi:hypothetical protein